MENIILYAVVAIAGLLTGIYAADRKAKREAESFAYTVMSEIIEKIKFIHAEVDNNVIYFYDYETSRFICKGDSVHQVLAVFNDLYPTMIAQVETGDEEAMKIFHEGFNFLNPDIKNLKV